MRPSTEKIKSELILDGKGLFYGIFITTDASNAVTVNIYDNVTASGKKIIPTWTVTTSATDRARSLNFNPPLPVDTGIYVDVACAGSVKYMVYSEAR